MLAPRPLFSLYRGGHEEVCVYGEIARYAEPGAPFVSGEGHSRVVARSLLKPFQFLATGLTPDAGDLPPQWIAALGSISANSAQVEQLRRWHAGSLVELSAHLSLPTALPMCAETRAREHHTGASPSQLFHPCFSKHVAILAACRQHGWPLAGYTEPGHPYQLALRTLLGSMLGRPLGAADFVEDGCRLPTPVLSPLELARLYRDLAAASEGSTLGALRRAMMAQPSWIGGPDRVDTRLMLRNPGTLVAKEGADGLLAVGIASTAAAPTGAGLVVKLAGGYQPAWAALALAPFLTALGLEPLIEPTPGQEVVWHVAPGREGTSPLDISPLLSERIAVWPGDTPYRRTPVSEPGTLPSGSGPSWELLVSSIHTTLHVGAHADAPNHFEPGALGIDRVPLGPYRGACEVVSVILPPGGVIQPSDLGGKLPNAPRVLFKTGSFPDPERFEQGFVAFSPELIRWLADAGVVLVGIDTPSVDPFSSKTLPSHHETRRARPLCILEGLELSRAEPGLYELVALPLRLEGADASPVRATLWPLR
jgi:arylformamidase